MKALEIFIHKITTTILKCWHRLILLCSNKLDTKCYGNLFCRSARGKSSYAKITQLRYLSQSALIEESVTPRIIRMTLIVVSSAIAILIIWAALTEVEEIAITQGQVVPSKHVQAVQHLEGGIVEDILATEGELVNKGQILIKLKGEDIRNNLSALELERLSLKYKEYSLRTFIDGVEPDFSNIDGKRNSMLEAEQMSAFKSMKEAKEAEKDIIEQQIVQKQDAVRVLEQKRNNLIERIKLVEEEKLLKDKLVTTGNLSRVDALQVHKEYNKVNGELGEVKSELLQGLSAINEYKERLESLSAQHIDEAYDELENLKTKISQVDEKVDKINAQVLRLDIKSPVYGYVKSLNVRTVGAVVQSAQILAEIVPLDDDLILEVKISPQDIGHAKKGQPVNVKITAYSFSRYGTIDGKVQYISPTTFVDNGGNSYYLGRVSIDKKYVGNDKKNLILPGMTAQADIRTGSKSILSYLLRPIYDVTDTALSER